MTFLFAAGMLLVLALIVVVSATKKNTERRNLAEAAKHRCDMRSNAKDVWANAVPVKATVHTTEPIEYDMGVSVSEDVSDSQYQILKAIFADVKPTPIENTKAEVDYWKDTEPLGFIK